MTLTTSVVICAYTEDRWMPLLDAVASVRTQHARTPERTVGTVETVVVIDHNDALLHRLTAELSRTSPEVRVIPSTGPKGLSGARNSGIAATSGDVVAFLDDDATAATDWLDHLLAPYADAHVLGVGGAAEPVWETGRPTWWPAEFGWVVGCSYPGQPTTLGEVRNLMGCNMSVRRAVLDAVGGFDTELGRTADSPAGCEETELCIRASALFPAGRFLFEPQALVHHRVPAARATFSYFSARCRAEGLSKARVARTVGQSSALSAEQAYVRDVLPRGLVRGLGESARGDLGGARRAAAIVAGLGLTAGGYLTARLSSRQQLPKTAAGSPGPARSGPTLPLVVDLSESPDPVDARRDDGSRHTAASVLVTRAGDPVAKVVVELPTADGSGTIPGPVLRDLVRTELDRAGIDLGPANVSALHPTRLHPSVLYPGAATVVVATRNRPERLQECLDSIMAGTVRPDRIVVVDNAPSDDRSAELLAELVAGLSDDQPRLEYVRENHPGLARAHNAGLRHVTAPIVAFTDDDVLVEKRWLERLVAAFENERVACVTGMIAPRELDTVPQQWIEGNVTYDKGLRRLRFDIDEHRPSDPLFPYTAGAFGSGANMAFRTAYLRGHGGFDEALGTGTYAMGGDDLAAFFDVVADGHTLVYEPAAIVMHLHYREYAGLRRQTYGYGAGLGAHLMRCLVRDPRTAYRLLRQAPAARRRAAAILHPPTVDGLPPYPADLSRQQRLGLVSGPWRYLVSRRRARHAPPIGEAAA